MTAMEKAKIDFVVRIKREQEKTKTKKSVRQRIAFMSDQSKNCLKQYVVTFIAFGVTFFKRENLGRLDDAKQTK